MASFRRIAPGLLLPLAIACRTPADDDAAHVVRDSEGIRIVESTRPHWRPGEAWRIGEPIVTIGAADAATPGHELDRVVAATRLTDGTIVVADAGARTLQRYDTSGLYLGSIGRQGQGPGEFRALGWAGRTDGDSLLTWDRGLNRVTVFSASGVVAREYRPALTELPMSLEVKGQLSGGRLLLARGASFVSADGGAGVQRQPITAWLLSPTGEETAAVGPFPGEAVWIRAGRTPGSMLRTPVPLGPATLFASGSNEVYVVDTEAFAARVHTDEGRLVRIVRRAHTRLPLRPEDVAADIERRLESVPPIPEIREGSRRSLEEVPPPELLPAVRAVRVDADEHLWMEAARRPGDTTAMWSVFDRDGVWLGEMMLPAALEVLEIGADYILGRDRDELDVQRVLLLPLRRARP